MHGSGGDDQENEANERTDFSLTGWRLKQLERGRTEADIRLDKLEAWKNWVLGAAGIIGLVAGLFAKQIWAMLAGH